MFAALRDRRRRSPNQLDRSFSTVDEARPDLAPDIPHSIDEAGLSGYDVAALLHLVVQAQLGLAGDEHAARLAAFNCAGWTSRLSSLVLASLDAESARSSASTAQAISDGLQELNALSQRGDFTELVSLAFGGSDTLEDLAGKFSIRVGASCEDDSAKR